MRIRDVVIGANASMYYRLNFSKIRGVFYPKSEQEVIQIILKANEQGLDITPKGGGSGLSGACTGGDRDRFMLSTLQMREILTISKDQGYVDVQPGATPNEINALLEPLRMKFYVAPSSRDIATVGGLISTDGGGNDTWVNGTMRDNTVHVKMVLYNGAQLVVDWNGVRSNDKSLEEELNQAGMTIHDVASSHGTLGIITELRVKIKPLVEEEVIGGVAEFNDYDSLGRAIQGLIDMEFPVRYGEALVQAHEDVRGNLKLPLLVLEYPRDDSLKDKLMKMTDFRPLGKEEVERLKDTRIKLPKRNPKEGIQVALFEGYGLHGRSLIEMNQSVTEINELLMEDGFRPFAKYGHAPSKWYLGNNSEAFGLVMHSREIRPEGRSGKEIFKTVSRIVDKCLELGITPKPEHKWPFSDEVKKKRIKELRDIIGGGFNSFILDENAKDVLGSMV